MVQDLMAAAAGEVEGFRTGMVAVVQTAGDALGLNRWPEDCRRRIRVRLLDGQGL
jgi:hypothetical protein